MIDFSLAVLWLCLGLREFMWSLLDDHPWRVAIVHAVSWPLLLAIDIANACRELGEKR